MSWWRSTTRRPRRPSFEMFWRIRSSMISRFLICAWLDIVRMFWIDQVPHANVKAAVSKCGKSSYDSSCAMATSGDYSRSFHSFVGLFFMFFKFCNLKIDVLECPSALMERPWLLQSSVTWTRCDRLVRRSITSPSWRRKVGGRMARAEKIHLGLTITVPAHVVVIKFTLCASTLRASALCILTELCIKIIFIS